MIVHRREARRSLGALHGWRGIAIVLAAACGGTITSADRTTQDVAEVVVSPLTASVAVGSTLPLQASVRDASGQTISGTTVVWSVQDTSIATVSPLGVVTARAVGATQVAASANGRSGLASISVTPVAVASVSVAPAKVDLAPGARTQLSVVCYDAAGKPLDGRATVWASSNASIATVDDAGAVTAIATGTATITATSEGVSGGAAVSVAIPAIASVAIQPRSATIQRAATIQLSATITDQTGAIVADRSPAWTSSNAGVAIVSASGLVTAIAPGSASIAAELDGKADTATISVVAVPVGSVTVQPGATALTVGQTTTLTATVRDANGAVVTDRSVAWTSSSAAVASVSQDGVVKALGTGSAVISATSEGSSGSATVTVTVAPVASISLQPTSTTLQRNMTATFTPTLRDASGNVLTGRVVNWSSADSTVARVSSSGVVTAVGLGATVITAASEGKSASASVTVAPGPVERVLISPTSISSLREGHSAQLSATAVDANGDVVSGAAFAWHSDNNFVAIVSASGLVTGVHSGTTTITATSAGKTGSASVRVR